MTSWRLSVRMIACGRTLRSVGSPSVKSWDFKLIEASKGCMRDTACMFRKKAGRVDNLQGGFNFWSAEEEKALLAFVKERKGKEMAHCGRGDDIFKDLEKEWQSMDLGTTRTAYALYMRHWDIRRKRAGVGATTLNEASFFFPPSPSQAPSPGRKRTVTATVLPTSTSLSSNGAKKSKVSPSSSASATSSPPPLGLTVSVLNSDSGSDRGSALDWLVIAAGNAHQHSTK